MYNKKLTLQMVPVIQQSCSNLLRSLDQATASQQSIDIWK